MKVSHTLSAWRRLKRPLCVAIGFFDGVHRGHARLIGRAVRDARRRHGEAWVLTFEPHPARVLTPAAAPRLLTPLPQKLAALARLGADGVMVLPFTRALADQPPERFLERLLGAAPSLAQIVVGPNWNFGRNRTGTADFLAAYVRPRGVRVAVARPARNRGAIISSTRIRAALARGDLRTVATMLGRPFTFTGRVTRGAQLGRTLGYPTANLLPNGEALPPHGIYAAVARIGRHLHPGVVSYGLRPTIPQATPRALIELHLFDFDTNLYGREIELAFIRRLRNERKFSSLRTLTAQIARDAQRARRVLQTSTLAKRIPLHRPEHRIIVPPEQLKERQKKTGEGSSAA